MAKFKFTDTSIRNLPAATGAHRIDYAEDDVRGLAVQTTYTGAKRFLLVYVAKATGQERRMVLGEFGPAPRLSVSAARRLAAEKRALVDLGRDPWQEAKEARALAEAKASRDSATLSNLMAAYVEHLKAAGKPSWKEIENAIARHLTPRKKLVATSADQVTVDDVMPVFHGLTKAGKLREAEKLRSYLRAAFTAAKKARTDASMHAFAGFVIHASPLQDLDVSRPREAAEKAAQSAKERKWALTEDQLRAYWRRIQALEDPVDRALLTFHLLTGGQRVVQLTRLTSTDYDVDRKTLTLRDTKGRRKVAYDHVVPLMPDAARALDALRRTLQDEDGEPVPPGPHLFTVSNGEAPAGYHNLWERMQPIAEAMVKAKEVDKVFSPGIIRKTVESRLQAAGVAREVRGYLLSHGLGGVQARHYEAHEFDEEKRAALEKLRALLEPKGKVILFPKKSGKSR